MVDENPTSFVSPLRDINASASLLAPSQNAPSSAIGSDSTINNNDYRLSTVRRLGRNHIDLHACHQRTRCVGIGQDGTSYGGVKSRTVQGYSVRPSDSFLT